MRDIRKLFNGIAVVIDDEINDKNASINYILKQLKSNNIPFVKYKELPAKEVIDNLQAVSFVLLDWKLYKALSPEDIAAGVKMTPEIERENDELNITFLKEIQEKCFCPIFIFTNEAPDSIKEKLKQVNLFQDGKCNNILIKSKEDFREDDSLFKEIEEWLKITAPIYLLKEWDCSYQNAKTKLFIDFQHRSPDWVKILWKTYEKEDKVNPSIELGELINKNIQVQMMPLRLDSSIFEGEAASNYKEVVSCLRGQCFIDKAYLEKDIPNTGDIFEDNGKTYINIRPCCDLVIRTEGDSMEKLELYLLEGVSKNEKSEISKLLNKKFGNFVYRESSFMIFPLYEDQFVEFKFKDLIIMDWGEIKTKRKGCLLPPFLTELQIKYSSYIQRQGLPRFPKDLFTLSDS